MLTLSIVYIYLLIIQRFLYLKVLHTLDQQTSFTVVLCCYCSYIKNISFTTSARFTRTFGLYFLQSGFICSVSTLKQSDLNLFK